MVAGDQGNVAEPLCILIPAKIGVEEAVDISAGILLKETVVFPVLVFVITQQGGVAVASVVEEEVHIKSGPQRLRRVAPFGDHCGIRKFELQHPADIGPDGACTGLLFVIIFDKRSRHVDTESVAAVAEPETHDVLERFSGRDGCRMLHRLLPGTGHLVETVIQGRLTLEEVEYVGSRTIAFAGHIIQTVGWFEAEIGPDIAVGEFIILIPLALPEPFMLFGRVSGDQIEYDMHSFFMGGSKQPVQILVRAVSFRDFFEIPDVIAGILKRRIKAGIDPDGIASESPDVIQLFRDSVDIADPVSVGIVKRLRIDFIKNCVVKPLCGHVFPPEMFHDIHKIPHPEGECKHPDPDHRIRFGAAADDAGARRDAAPGQR